MSFFCPICNAEDKGSAYVHVLNAKKGDHYYVIIKNTWDNGPDIIYHDPTCICGNGEKLAREDLKKQNTKIPIKTKSLNSSEILRQEVQMMGMTPIQDSN
jgi:hypothetical protein